jgi:hypothetical protein
MDWIKIWGSRGRGDLSFLWLGHLKLTKLNEVMPCLELKL